MFLKNVFAPWASAICLISFGILSVANAQKSPLRLAKLVYVSPLEIPLEVSGAFGEFRPGHFHSGVDFRIGGVEGAPVHAIYDGYLARIVVRPDGFGKALYINHPDGRTSVYAHLDSFADSITALVRARQYASMSFSLDISLKPGEYPVKTNDLIGFGGNSGSSFGPHLHFELRDQRTELTQNFFAQDIYRPADTLAPVLKGLYVYALDTVMGAVISHRANYPVRTCVEVNQMTRLSGGDTLLLPPQAYLGIDAEDMKTDAKTIYPVYSVRLSIDGINHFESVRNAFSFTNTRFANAVCDQQTVGDEKRNVMRLYKPLGWEVDFYKIARMQGLIRLRPGQCSRVCLRLEDESGRRRDILFVAKLDPNYKKFVPERSVRSDKSWFVTSLQADKKVGVGDFEFLVPARSRYEPSITKLNIRKIDAAAIPSAIEISEAEIPGSFGGTTWHNASLLRYPVQAFAPELLSKLVWVRLSAPDALLRKMEVNSVPTRFDDKWVEGRLTSSGLYTLLLDTIAPQILPLNVVQGETIGTKSPLLIEIKDDLSGIASYQADWNGAWVLTEYDRKSDRLLIRPGKDMKNAAEGILTISVKDKAGNERVEKISLKL